MAKDQWESWISKEAVVAVDGWWKDTFYIKQEMENLVRSGATLTTATTNRLMIYEKSWVDELVTDEMLWLTDGLCMLMIGRKGSE